VVLLALYIPPLSRVSPSIAYGLLIAPGPDGPVILDKGRWQDHAVGAIQPYVNRKPAVTLCGVTILVEDSLDLSASAFSSWPWPEKRPIDVADSLREEIADAMVYKHIEPSSLPPGWWDEPKLNILWGRLPMLIGRLAAWVLLATGLYMTLRWSKAAFICARLARGLCPKCKYNMHGIEKARCPECGRELSDDEQSLLS